MSAEGSQSIQGQVLDNAGINSGIFNSKPIRIDTSVAVRQVRGLTTTPRNPANPVFVSTYAWDQYTQASRQRGRASTTDAWAPLGDPVPVYFPGVHTAEVIAWDLVGNVATASCSPFTVAAEGGAPTGGFEVDGGAVWTRKVLAPVTCDVAGATQMRFKAGSDAWGGLVAYSSNTTITLPVAEGACEVVAEFKDSSSNTVTRTASVNIDRTKPTTTTSNVTETTTRRQATEFIFVGHDALSGPSGCAYRLDGGPVQYGDSCAVSTPGPHTIEYWAYDLAGNEGDHSTSSFYMTHRPQLQVTVAPVTPTAGEMATVSARLVDELGAPMPNATVWINESPDGANFDPTLGVGTTDANGRVSFQTRLLKPTWYRAGFAETAQSNGAVSGVRYVAPLAPTLVLDSVSPTAVDYGGTVTVRGRLLWRWQRRHHGFEPGRAMGQALWRQLEEGLERELEPGAQPLRCDHQPCDPLPAAAEVRGESALYVRRGDREGACQGGHPLRVVHHGTYEVLHRVRLPLSEARVGSLGYHPDLQAALRQQVGSEEDGDRQGQGLRHRSLEVLGEGEADDDRQVARLRDAQGHRTREQDVELPLRAGEVTLVAG